LDLVGLAFTRKYRYPYKPSRYGSPDHCDKIDKDSKQMDCVGSGDRSLLHNAYRIAVGDKKDVIRDEIYRTYWPQKYFVNNEVYQETTGGNQPVKIKESGSYDII